MTNLEKRITSDLKLLKYEEIIDKATYKNIKSVGSIPGVLYRLGNVHNETNHGFPPFCSILSDVGTPTYKLGNEYIFTDPFHIAKEICKQDPNLYMASLDVHSLSTNIP